MMPLRHCCMVDACHWLQQCVHGDKRAPLLIFYLLWVWFAHSMIWSASFTQMQKHALVANDLVNGEKKMLREEEALFWNTQEDGSTDDEEMSELVKVKRTKGKENNQKENQREIKPNHQIPWVREEANRGGGGSGEDLFLTAAPSPYPSPMTKQATLMFLMLPSPREPAQLHNIYCCYKQGRGERNGAPEEKTHLNLI